MRMTKGIEFITQGYRTKSGILIFFPDLYYRTQYIVNSLAIYRI